MTSRPGLPGDISVVVPAFQAESTIAQALGPLLDLKAQGALGEVIVVDDRSTDATADIARRLGASVLATPARSGPAAARNLGAESASGAIVWFVDADVVVDPASLEAIREAIAQRCVWAVCGSLDDRAPQGNFATQYLTLVHNYRHRVARPDAILFWAGCGAVRRDKFLQIGGFDAEAYPAPSIEDIELGYRIRDCGGSILGLRGVAARHLKTWTLRSVVSADIFRLALPWSRLMLSRPRFGLSLSYREWARAHAAWALLLSLLASLAGVAPPEVPIVAAGLAAAVNGRLLVYLARRRNPIWALFGVAFHQARYVVGSLAFAWGWWRNRQRPAPSLDLGPAFRSQFFPGQ